MHPDDAVGLDLILLQLLVILESLSRKDQFEFVDGSTCFVLDTLFEVLDGVGVLVGVEDLSIGDGFDFELRHDGLLLSFV